jgi:ketosteroid isomerase-like protein
MHTRSDPLSTARELAALRRAFQDAVGRSDVDAAAITYDDDARILLPSGQVIDGRVAIASYWRAGFEAGMSGIEFVPDGFEFGDGVAWESGQYGLLAQPPYEEPATERGRYLTVHRRGDDGRWRRAIDVLSPTP